MRWTASHSTLRQTRFSRSSVSRVVGKSVTALSVIQLVAQPAGFIAGGAIYYKGQDITRLPEVEKRWIQGNDIAMVFQEPMTSLNPVFTIGYQISEAIRQHQDFRGTAARNAAVEMLDLVGIPEPAARYDEYPHQMSGGMKQRVMIAMALSCRPGLSSPMNRQPHWMLPYKHRSLNSSNASSKSCKWRCY